MSCTFTIAFYDKQINWTHNISKSDEENLMQDKQIFALLITRICYCTENVVKTFKIPQKMFELILLFSFDRTNYATLSFANPHLKDIN